MAPPTKKHLASVAPEPIRLDEDTFSQLYTQGTAHISDAIVGDSHVVSGDSGAALYVVWTVRVIINDALHSLIALYKRYSEMEKLRNDLLQEFPGEALPALPPKDNLSLQRLWLSQLWLEHRRKGLQWFLSNVLLNPKFHDSQAVRKFIFP